MVPALALLSFLQAARAEQPEDWSRHLIDGLVFLMSWAAVNVNAAVILNMRG